MLLIKKTADGGTCGFIMRPGSVLVTVAEIHSPREAEGAVGNAKRKL